MVVLALQILLFAIAALFAAAYVSMYRTIQMGRRTWGSLQFGAFLGFLGFVLGDVWQPLRPLLLALAGGLLAGAIVTALSLLALELWKLFRRP